MKFPTHKDREPLKNLSKQGKKTKKAYKKVYNNKVRNCEEVGNNGNYKKVFDYQWTIN